MLTEMKNRTCKYFKSHYSTVQSMKTVAVLIEDGYLPSFFDSLKSPCPLEFAIQGKKMLMPGG